MILTAASGCAAPTGTIGAALGQDRADHRLYVRSVPQGQGAADAGLLPDDEILGLDGKDVHVMTEEEVRSAVRGEVGSTLRVTALRDGRRLEVVVKRTAIKGR